MNNLCKKCSGCLAIFGDLAALFFRLLLAYSFYPPAMKKINDIESFTNFLIEKGVMYPEINAYAATITESLGVILLILGLGTRLITIPMMVVMAVSVWLVHWGHGFNLCENGYQLNVFLFVMLLSLFGTGAGKFSLDSVLHNKWCKKSE